MKIVKLFLFAVILCLFPALQPIENLKRNLGTLTTNLKELKDKLLQISGAKPGEAYQPLKHVPETPTIPKERYVEQGKKIVTAELRRFARQNNYLRLEKLIRKDYSVLKDVMDLHEFETMTSINAFEDIDAWEIFETLKDELLLTACKHGSDYIVERALVKRGGFTEFFGLRVDPTRVIDKQNKNNTPLHYACEVGDAKIVKHLLEWDVDHLKKNTDRKTPFDIAITKVLEEENARKQSYRFKVVKHILEKMTEKQQKIDLRNTKILDVLFLACKKNAYETVEAFVKNDIRVLKIHKKGKFLLHRACKRGHLETVQVLVNNQASPTQHDVNGDTPVHHACRLPGNTENALNIVQFLAEAGKAAASLPFIKNTNNETPMYLALKAANFKIVAYLSQLPAFKDFFFEKTIAELIQEKDALDANYLSKLPANLQAWYNKRGEAVYPTVPTYPTEQGPVEEYIEEMKEKSEEVRAELGKRQLERAEREKQRRLEKRRLEARPPVETPEPVKRVGAQTKIEMDLETIKRDITTTLLTPLRRSDISLEEVKAFKQKIQEKKEELNLKLISIEMEDLETSARATLEEKLKKIQELLDKLEIIREKKETALTQKLDDPKILRQIQELERGIKAQARRKKGGRRKEERTPVIE